MNFTKADQYESRAFNIEILVHQEGFTEADAKRAVIWSELLFAVGKRKCKTLGHNLVSDGYGGPESGGDGCHCTRCGYSFFHQFY